MPGIFKNKRILRIICLGLVICICFSVVMSPKAHAISELIIVGALALTIAACAAVVIIAAEPMGLKDTIVSAAQHGFQTPNEFVADLLARYGASQGLQQFVLMDKFQKGVFLTTTGKMILDATISNFLTDFYEWAWYDADLMQFAPVTGLQTVNTSTIPNFPISINANMMYGSDYVEVPIQSPSYIYSGNCPFGLVNRGGQTQIVFFSDSVTSINYYDIYGGVSATQSVGIPTSRTIDGVNYTFYYKSPAVYSTTTTDGLWSQSSFDRISAFNLAYIYYHAQDYMTGGGDPTYEEDALVLPAPGTGSNVLDLPGAMTLPAPISGTTTATNYLEAVADAITAGTGSLEYEDANGLTQTGTLEGTDTIGLTQVGAHSAELEGSIEIADSIGSPTLDNYSLDLKNFFPFCIPFDLRDMLKLIKSAPAPVSVEWTFDFGDLGTQVLEIDLQEFNALAQTLRSMELLAFCVGLALATKRLLMGS